jgi:hypothetical protein
LSIWDEADAAKRDVAQLERCQSAVDAVFAPEEPCPLPSEAR